MSLEGSSQKAEDFTIDLVVKVGGSCLTDKSGCEQLRQDGLERLAELAAAIQAAHVDGGNGDEGRRRLRWLLLHGAGSFGHPHAAAARLTDKSDGPHLAKLPPAELQRRRLGFCDTRRAVLGLSNLVVGRLVTANVPAVALSPCSHFSETVDLAAPRLPAELASRLRDLLGAGFVPALHGDAVLALDRSGDSLSASIGWSVLGGDVLAAQLAGSFRLRRVVFVTSAGGVYSADPATADPGTAQLLKEVRLSSGGSVSAASEIGDVAPGVSDVTGGMRGKLAAAARLLQASPGTEVRVCGWDSALSACLGASDVGGGGSGGGTRVLAD